MSGSDELFELKNYFYLGNYSAAMTEGATVSVSDQGGEIERDVILARIRSSRGEHAAVTSSISETSHIALQAVRLLSVLRSDASQRDTVIAAVTAWLDDPVATASASLVHMCAVIHAALGDYDAALRAAARCPQAIESLALKVQVLLAMDRADAAEKEVARMSALDEDATLTQLAGAWVNLSKGSDAAQEAVYIYQDLLERHGSTDRILNGLALCHLAMGKPDEAERVLQEALAKNPNFPATLINVITVANYKNKPVELVRRYMERLTQVAPDSPWVVDYAAKQAEFSALSKAVVV